MTLPTSLVQSIFQSKLNVKAHCFYSQVGGKMRPLDCSVALDVFARLQQSITSFDALFFHLQIVTAVPLEHKLTYKRTCISLSMVVVPM